MTDDHPPRQPFPVPPARVLETVAAAYGLTVDQLTGPDRRNPRPAARRVAYRLLRDESWLSWAGVADIMRRRLHGGTAASSAVLADPEAVRVLRDRIHRNGRP